MVMMMKNVLIKDNHYTCKLQEFIFEKCKKFFSCGFHFQVKAHVVFSGSNVFELQLNLHGVS